MKLRKLATGNYFGYYKGYYVFARKKVYSHDAFWMCCYGKGGEWLGCEGVHSSWIRNITIAKKWAKKKIHLKQNKLEN